MQQPMTPAYHLISDSNHDLFLHDLRDIMENLKNRKDVLGNPTLHFSTTTSGKTGRVIYSVLIEYVTTEE